MKLLKEEIRVLKDIKTKGENWRHPQKDESIVDDLISLDCAVEEIRQMPNKYWMSFTFITSKGLQALKEYKK